jgi:hypothetical protein
MLVLYRLQRLPPPRVLAAEEAFSGSLIRSHIWSFDYPRHLHTPCQSKYHTRNSAGRAELGSREMRLDYCSGHQCHRRIRSSLRLWEALSSGIRLESSIHSRQRKGLHCAGVPQVTAKCTELPLLTRGTVSLLTALQGVHVPQNQQSVVL